MLAAVAFVFAYPSLAGPPSASPANPRPARLLFGATYPLEVSAEFHPALLHWLDSLANLTGPGATAGKTVEAHRVTYVALHGEPW
jgi:hypothetical protein